MRTPLTDSAIALARLTGNLDAAIEHPDWCPMSLEEIREKLIAARRLLFTEQFGAPPGEDYR